MTAAVPARAGIARAAAGLALRAVLVPLFLACPALAETVPTGADMAALTAVLERRGCVIENYNDQGILTDSGLSADVANAGIAKMVADGTVFFDDKGMNLKTPKCVDAAQAPNPDRTAFIALMEKHGCTLKLEEAEAVLSEEGFTPATLNPIADAMMADGTLVMSETEFTLKTGTCK